MGPRRELLRHVRFRLFPRLLRPPPLPRLRIPPPPPPPPPLFLPPTLMHLLLFLRPLPRRLLRLPQLCQEQRLLRPNPWPQFLLPTLMHLLLFLLVLLLHYLPGVQRQQEHPWPLHPWPQQHRPGTLPTKLHFPLRLLP